MKNGRSRAEKALEVAKSHSSSEKRKILQVKQGAFLLFSLGLWHPLPRAHLKGKRHSQRGTAFVRSRDLQPKRIFPLIERLT